MAHEVPHLDPAKHWLIDLWNKACGKWGRYNEETGYFELNGLTDITYDQALTIYITFNGETRPDYSMLNPQPSQSHQARTLLPITNWIDPVDCSRLISVNDYIEAVRFAQNRWFPAAITLRVGGSAGFTHCPKLKSILADGGLTIAANAWFDADPLLETVQICPYRNFSLRFPDSPLLSLESVKYMVTHPVEVTAVTIILHPEVFAKLTDDENEEWHALLEQAAAKNITFAEA